MPSVYNFKVFKATTRFKKHNRGYTKMTRKKYAKRKHKSNWYAYTYISSSWSNIFLKNRRFIRFYQSLGLFKFMSYASTPTLFNRQLSTITNHDGIFLFSSSKNVINFFNNVGTFHINFPLKNVNVSGVGANSYKSLVDSDVLNPGLILLDKVHYPHNPTIENIDSLVVLSKFNDSMFLYSTNYTLAVYKTLIMLTIVRTF